MKNKKLLKLEISGGIFLIFAGSFMHFVYSNFWPNLFTSLIAPINESVWEHMKLAYFPLFVFSIFEFLILKFKNKSKFFFTKVSEMYLIMLVTTVSFYTYSGILGYNLLIADILTYVLAVIVGQVFSYKALNNDINKKNYLLWGWFLLTILIFCFSLFTFWQPNISLFIPQG